MSLNKYQCSIYLCLFSPCSHNCVPTITCTFDELRSYIYDLSNLQICWTYIPLETKIWMRLGGYFVSIDVCMFVSQLSRNHALPHCSPWGGFCLWVILGANPILCVSQQWWSHYPAFWTYRGKDLSRFGKLKGNKYADTMFSSPPFCLNFMAARWCTFLVVNIVAKLHWFSNSHQSKVVSLSLIHISEPTRPY